MENVKIKNYNYNDNNYSTLKIEGEFSEPSTKLIERSMNLFTSGSVGIGKTYTMEEILKQYLSKNKLYINSITKLQSDIFKTQSVETILSNIKSQIDYSGYFILDDVGSEDNSANLFGTKINLFERLIMDIVYPMYKELEAKDIRLHIYMNSNKNLIEIIDYYRNDRVIDRLCEMVTFVEVEGESLRKAQDLSFIYKMK